MRVLLVAPKFPISFYSLGEFFPGLGRKTTNPPLGLLTVAALLPADWELRLVDENVRPLAQDDYDFADTVWIGAMLPQRESALELVREAKARGRHVVGGGPFASSVPQEMIEAGCDVLVRGEAENQVPELVEAVLARRTGVLLEAGVRPSMTTSPMPRYDLIDFANYYSMSLQTTRGCPHNCEFCDVVNLNGRAPRSKTCDQVIAELSALFDLGWRGHVFLCDDNIIGDQKYARELLGRMVHWSKDHGEPFQFTAQASIDLARHKDLIDMLTEANVGEVFIGIETPDEDVLRKANKSNNVRNPLAESLRFIVQNGLLVQGSFIIGLDGERPGAGQRVIDFAQRAGLPQVMLNMLTALPGTMLWHRYKKDDRVLPFENTQDMLLGVRMNTIPDRPTQEVIAEYVDAIAYLYSPTRYMKRVFDHIMLMRPTRTALALQQVLPTVGKGQLVTGGGLKWLDVRVGLAFFWRHGIKARHRGQFWLQIVTIWRKNPSRLLSYIMLCIKCEAFSGFAKMAQARALELGVPLLRVPEA
ncbi:MAG: B12-binding domain-containing radical SAM protein [Proteobacteria bacterium]|nr:B12-binding domain-containing radical SAM protein [Pseudomonadota bacterium]